MKKIGMMVLVTLTGCLFMVGAGYAQTPNDPLYSQQTYINAVNVPHAWQTTQGNAGQKIAIIALGGVNSAQQDLSSRVVIKATGSPTAETSCKNWAHPLFVIREVKPVLRFAGITGEGHLHTSR